MGLVTPAFWSNKTGSRRIDKTHPTKNYINCIIQFQVLLNLWDLTRKYRLFDRIGNSGIGSNKTGSRRIAKTHQTKNYRGSPLSTNFGTWKKSYYLKFVLVE